MPPGRNTPYSHYRQTFLKVAGVVTTWLRSVMNEEARRCRDDVLLACEEVRAIANANGTVTKKDVANVVKEITGDVLPDGNYVNLLRDARERKAEREHVIMNEPFAEIETMLETLTTKGKR